MGYGSYTAADWSKLKSSRGLSSSSNANNTFKNTTINDKYNSRFIEMRESFDSEDSPNSTPVIIGFDVTGSMGYLANEIATNSLNETIQQILIKKPVSDPHMMCCAVTDSSSPIQATQFEADIRVVEQLLDFKLGGGNKYAYDTMLWYFAANHTKTDCYEKRGQKGILIGIGDEICGMEFNNLNHDSISNAFNETSKGQTFSELFQAASKKYEIIHIVIGGKSRFAPNNAYDSWKEALPGRVAGLKDENIEYLSNVIVAIMQLINGESIDVVLAEYSGNDKAIIENAIKDIDITKPINAVIQNNNQSAATVNKQSATKTEKKSSIFNIFKRNKK